MTAVPLAAGSPDSDLYVMTEAEMATLRAGEGARVAERHGRFWVETFRGFYQPIHQLGRHRFTDVTRPTPICWGYRSALLDEDRHLANGALPVHLMTNLAGFTVHIFEESRLRDLRKCRSQVEIVRVRDPEIFLQNGWQVYLSSKQRVPKGGTLGQHEYLRDIAGRSQDPRRLIVAGLISGKLAGYLESYAVDGILYGRELYVATEAMRTGIATGLYLETFEIGARSQSVHSLCLGPVLRERPGLAWFKKTLGVPVVHVPARVEIPAPIRAVMKLRQPAVYYRITGRQAGSAADLASAGPDQ